MSLSSSLAFRRFLSSLVPLIVYSLLAVGFAWGAWLAGWQSGGCAVYAILALFFGGVVAGEVRYVRTGSHR